MARLKQRGMGILLLHNDILSPRGRGAPLLLRALKLGGFIVVHLTTERQPSGIFTPRKECAKPSTPNSTPRPNTFVRRDSVAEIPHAGPGRGKKDRVSVLKRGLPQPIQVTLSPSLAQAPD
jgi:hypothetical protein